MKLKGLAKFREKTPALAGKKILLLPLYIIGVVISSLLLLVFFDNFPLIVAANTNTFIGMLSVLSPILGVLLMLCIGLILVYQVWYHRDRLKEQYEHLAYQKIFLVGFGGVFILISVSIHNVISILTWQESFWTQAPFSFFTISLTSLIPVGHSLISLLRVIVGILTVILGILLIIRAFFTFGIDYMAVVYLYFPEESNLQDHRIYSILRHPAYAGSLMVCLGGIILQLNLYSVIFFILYYLALYIHIHYVEERELIHRFGESYKIYRDTTRAFFVKLTDIDKLLAFIIGKDKPVQSS
ncbi:MAG: isoprenylcysteine carboxylmethyltransferase family protein [Promethearchaeia archaeon]